MLKKSYIPNCNICDILYNREQTMSRGETGFFEKKTVISFRSILPLPGFPSGDACGSRTVLRKISWEVPG